MVLNVNTYNSLETSQQILPKVKYYDPRYVEDSTQNVENNTLISSFRIPRKGVSIQMEDIRRLSVSESNELIYSAPKADGDVIKLFELAVAGLNKNEKDHVVSIETEALFNFLDLENKKDKARHLKKLLDKTLDEMKFDLSASCEKGKIIKAFEMIEWSIKDGYVNLTFTNSIMPYLKEFEGKYTRYALEDISKLTNKYSVFLYKIFSMNFNQYKKYKNEKLRNPYFTLEELRTLLNVKEDEYQIIGNFSKRVIADPISDINENTTLKVTYNKKKSMRYVVGFEFHIEENTINLSNKDQILKPKLTKAEREQQRNISAAKAMSSNYTKFLNRELFIGPNELMDVNLMSRLYEDLYPLYDQIKEKQGIQKVEQHIKYIHAHLNNPVSEINDVVAYLVTCAKSLLKDTTFDNQN